MKNSLRFDAIVDCGHLASKNALKTLDKIYFIKLRPITIDTEHWILNDLNGILKGGIDKISVITL